MTTRRGCENYSSCSSDSEESLDSCASKCLLLQELPEQVCQVHSVSVGRSNFRGYYHQYKELLKLIF
jgi:hypothetical protein